MAGKTPLKKKPAKKVEEPKAKAKMPTRKVEDIVSELESLKAKRKDIEEREKKLKDDLGIIVEGEGVKTSTGSFNLIVGDKLAQKQARKSFKINPEKAEKLFKEKGIWEEVTETKQVINEDFVEQAIVSEKLTADELETVLDTKVIYALVVTDYKPEESSEDMPLIKPSK